MKTDISISDQIRNYLNDKYPIYDLSTVDKYEQKKVFEINVKNSTSRKGFLDCLDYLSKNMWISIKDKFPESDTEVNVLLKDGRVKIATFIINNDFKSFYMAGSTTISYGSVTHWAFLPEAIYL